MRFIVPTMATRTRGLTPVVRASCGRRAWSGFVGEGADGELKPRPSKDLDADADLGRRVRAIMDEENGDRLLIMERLVETTPSLEGKEGLKLVRQIFASRQRELAKPGEWIQEPDGRWARKAE